MNKVLSILAVLLVALIIIGLAAILIPGCTQPPPNTVKVENGLAWDLDNDGKADLDENGKVKFIPGSQAYKPAEAADSILPTALSVVGGLLGIPILVGAGKVWGAVKPGRILVNTLMSVQNARRELAKGNYLDAFEVVTDELSNQLPETQKMIRDLKDKIGVQSVTDKLKK